LAESLCVSLIAIANVCLYFSVFTAKFSYTAHLTANGQRLGFKVKQYDDADDLKLKIHPSNDEAPVNIDELHFITTFLSESKYLAQLERSYCF